MSGRHTGPWSVNIHYDRLLDGLVLPETRAVLDVGCGDGLLSARLARRIPRVTALDRDEAVLGRARARYPDAPVDWVAGDVLTSILPAAPFAAVVSNATLHHLPDARAALARLGELVAPGGRLAIVTFVRPRVVDLPWAALAFVARGVASRVRGSWEHSAPQCWPPPDTLTTLRSAVAASLPGARVRRLLYGRVLIRWDRPPTSCG